MILLIDTQAIGESKIEKSVCHWNYKTALFCLIIKQEYPHD